jgi:lipoprotein-releasing system permease protein
VLVSRGARARGVVIKGVLPDSERRVGQLLQTVKFGSAAALAPSDPCPKIAWPTGGGGVAGDVPGSIPPGCPGVLKVPDTAPPIPPLVLGKGVADELGATVGSVVLVTSPQGELTPFGMVPKYVRFQVVGIFESGFYDYDTAWAFTRLADAQRLFGLGDVVSVIEFKVDDLDRAGEIGGELERAAGSGFMSTNWMEQNRALFRALRLERRVTFITVGLIVLVAALNILISLIMMVMEKTRDIAVLLSLGARRAQVRNIFLLEGVLIGVVGTVLGLAVGYALAWAGGHYRWISLSPEIYSIDYVPFAPRLIDGLLVALMSLGISFLATLYPSWSAARILPAEALRYE